MRKVHDFAFYDSEQYLGNLHTVCLLFSEVAPTEYSDQSRGSSWVRSEVRSGLAMGIGFNFQNRLSETNPIRFSS